MRTMTRWLGLVTTVFGLAVLPAVANPARGGTSATAKAHGPKTTTVTSSTTAASPKGTTVKSSTVKTKSSSAGPKATSVSKGATTTKSTTLKGHSAAAKTKSSATTRTSTKSGTTTTSPTTTSSTTSGSTTTSSSGTGSTVNGTTWTPDNPVAQKLSKHSNILKKVTNSLGTDADLNNATAGFKNFGQFVAAVNVSNNLGIDFVDLKAAMTGITMDGKPVTSTGTTSVTAGSGTTSATTMSLGKAIQKLKSGVDAETVAQNALTQANQEINNSTASTSSTSTASSPTSTSTSTSASTATITTKAKPKSR